SRNPGWRARALAGGAAALMMLVRVSTLTVLPALVVYLAWNIWKRTPPDPAMRIREGIRQFAPFAIPAAAGILAMAVVNYAKFGAAAARPALRVGLAAEVCPSESAGRILFQLGHNGSVFLRGY